MRALIAIIALSLLSCSKSDESVGAMVVANELLWSKSYGGSGDEKIGGAVATPDGGFIVIGYTDSNDNDIIKTHASVDIWLARFSADGQIIWSKTYGGSADDYGMSIIATSDGNYAIGGYSGSNDGEVPDNLGMHDFYIAKITGDGNMLWSKNYGFLSHDHAHKLMQTRDGGFFIAGYADYAGIDGSGQGGDNGDGHSMRSNVAEGVMHGVGEFFGVKLDANGNFEWYRYYGGTMNDRVNDVVEANDGGIIMAGYTESEDFDIVGSKGSYDYWVIKLHSDGALHWKKNYGGSGIDQGFGIVKTNNNSYLMVGRSNSEDGDISNPQGNFDSWVIHINDHGDLLWEKSFGGAEYDDSSTIRKIQGGNYVVVGNTRGNAGSTANVGQNDAWIYQIDNFVNTGIHWQQSFGGSQIDMAMDVVQTPDGIIVVGESQSSDFNLSQNHGMNDLMIAKIR
ncbi:MAG: hypothetical protein ITG00_09760 [Flavobacterium sp.]|nr:hypothetical protein [Flavobacterium sp.]